ncbi:MAG: glycoside hydrolase [Gammaproteobacteria bacterium]|nr:glycoside hydrolase [Gammaproteobacteria bacterium]MDH5302878.1 glycoside hydrolase [Gammaproteobacteria bacterium]
MSIEGSRLLKCSALPAGCVLLALVAACAREQAPAAAPAAAMQAESNAMPDSQESVSEEYLVLGNANRGAGEPMIAVDPTNPDNMIIVAMGNIQQLHGRPATRGSTGDYHLVPGSTINWLAVTNDGGISWEVSELPILSGTFTRCPDAFADVTADGVFIAGCEPRETHSSPDHFGMSAFMMSADKGKTWGPVVPMISDFALDRFAPGLAPVSGGFPPGSPDRVATHSPWDRPFTQIDDSTGVIYGTSGGGWTTSGAPPGERRSQAYITASTDGGKSFGNVYAWDSPEYPQSSRGISAAAGHGIVAVGYVAASAPSAACPCVVLGISRNQGESFDYRVLDQFIVTPPAPGERPSNGGFVNIAIDPSRTGRIALLKYEAAAYSVAISEDFGTTWGEFVPAGHTPEAVRFTKPAFEFSRDGVLGLIWRAVYDDDSYDIWAAVSLDGGQSFGASHRVSHARSPAFDKYRNAGLFGDDIQDLAMDNENLHLVWGDSRAGFQGVWYGRLTLRAD